MKKTGLFLRDLLVLQNYGMGDCFIPIEMETKQGVKLQGRIYFHYKVYELNGLLEINYTENSRPVDGRLAAIFMLLLHGKHIPTCSKLLLPFKKDTKTDASKIDLQPLRKVAKSIVRKFPIKRGVFKKRSRKCSCSNEQNPTILIVVKDDFCELNVSISVTGRISIEVYNPNKHADQMVEALRAYWLNDILPRGGRNDDATEIRFVPSLLD